ncbi:ATP-binding protein [Merismopedia glauca]|uniref:AAA+ family ATPase n=1 Tax=Merismopedia glauca CCAP 1448/3 TaxID=1296344 RepID=A0A2T1C112_9CYAN|nr:ATP-binding protein [Merismopedia glauca]PSB01932.1 AAA+ family ATPase [Merismopedia glauca CCAP 1448/3]
MIKNVFSQNSSPIELKSELNCFLISQKQTAALVLYQSVLTDRVGESWVNLLESLIYSHNNPAHCLNCLQAYGNWFKALAEINLGWQEYLITRILRDENPFSQQVQRQNFDDLPQVLLDAAAWDLRMLQGLYQLDNKWLRDCVERSASDRISSTLSDNHPPLPIVPATWSKNPSRGLKPAEIEIYTKFATAEDWVALLPDLAGYYRQCGTGIFAEYQALRWQSGELVGIKTPDPVRITDLCGYEEPKQQLIKNTEFLLAGYPALNILLYGSRGSGKSSLVKGLLNQYSDRSLRLIEVPKSELQDLPQIVEQLRDLPQKFIIFVDDLSFAEDDEAFKALKVVLEGSVTARPSNVVVYATSNRRHLVREFFADRPRPKDADEVQSWDTVQEKLSFSDRFGLTLTFEPADQETYLEIVRHLAALAQIDIPEDNLDYRALQWATRHNGRSGRTARQFIDFLTADLGN